MYRQPHSDRSWRWNLTQLSSNQDRVADRRRRHAHVPGHLERPVLDGQPLGRRRVAGPGSQLSKSGRNAAAVRPMAGWTRPAPAGDGACPRDRPLEWPDDADPVASTPGRTPPMMSPPDDPADLEPPPDRMRAMGEAVLARLIDHIAALDDQPACGDVRAEDLCRAMREPLPEHGEALEGLLDPLFRDWIPRSFNAASPGYLAYIPGGGIFPAALADLIADGVNRFTGVWRAAPALVQLEANALDWLRDWMGFPATTRGLFTTGGSMATFNAVVCARERLLGPDLRPASSTPPTRPMPRSPNRPGWPASCPTGCAPSRSTRTSACVSTPWARRSRRTAAPGCDRSWSSRRPARPTPAPWTRWRRLRTSAAARGCGTTSTGPTARSFTWSSRCGHCWPGSPGPTR